MSLTHLQRLEAEAIHIFREVVANFANPVMLYSVGKDSAVMLHLAMKAFYPGKPPFPLLHVDTTWKFREMIRFRDETVAKLGLKLLVNTLVSGVIFLAWYWLTYHMDMGLDKLPSIFPQDR